MSLASTAMLLTGSAQAANTFFNTGDLMLYFQKVGSTNTIYVSLGNAATNFRGSAAGPTADRQSLNILNLNTTLTDAFGADWASQTNIYAGAAAANSSNASLNANAVFNGDQHRTLYLSDSRTSVGTVGLANSEGYDLTTSLPYTGAATAIIGMGNIFDVNGTLQQEIITTSVSGIDDNNPISIAPITGAQSQGAAFGNSIVGGVQQRGSATAFGTFGLAGNAEFALDLYRIVPRADSATTGEVSGVQHIGSFEGTIVVNSDGDVSFVTVPEPSGALALGILGTVAGLGYRRRRNA